MPGLILCGRETFSDGMAMASNGVYYSGPHRLGKFTIERDADGRVLIGVRYRADDGAPAHDYFAIPAEQAAAIAEAIYRAGKGEKDERRDT